MDVRRVILNFYGFQFFFSLLLWAPVFYEYQKKMGLSDEQIFGIQSIYYLAFCLFEIPTGYLADRWSQRKCMISGSLLLVAANLLVIYEPSYHGFLAHWLLIALSRSLISGASSAYLYNYLQHHGQPDWYKGSEGRARAYSLAGKVFGWAGIGFLMQWKLELPYWLTALSAAVAVVYAWTLPEFTLTARHDDKPSPRRVLTLVLGSPYLMLVILQGIGIFVLARIVQVNLFQPVLEAKGFGVEGFGVIMAVNTLFEALGSAYPGWFRRFMSDLDAVFFLTLAMAFSCSLTAVGGPIQAVVWLSVFALATGFSYPIQRQVLNDAIPDSRYRASLLSVESLMDRAVCAWVAAQLGSWVAAGRVNDFLHLSDGVTLAGVL
ncbi:MAG: MFS transporter, partial [Candidatus Eremiobacterota bacterium]